MMTMFQEDVRNGRMLLGTMISEIACPNIIRMMKAGGYEFVIIDGEHGPFTTEQMANLIAVGNGIGFPVLVRIPSIERGLITKILDMGADGFLVPMVNTKEDAQRLVQYAKYSPIGKRGISTTRAHTNYQPPPISEYMEQANKKTVLLTQIETKEAVSNAEEIAAVEGVDALIVGPSDLSSDLGDPGNLHTEEMSRCIAATVAAAKRSGKICGTVSANIPYLLECREKGMTLFSQSSELGMILGGAKRNVKKFQEEVLKESENER